MIPDPAIVRHMRVSHQQTIVADRRIQPAAHRAAMNRDKLANRITIAAPTDE
jgi:hypothetical protein